MIFTLKIKYYWDIKGNNIKIYIPPLIWRITLNILKRDIQSSHNIIFNYNLIISYSENLIFYKKIIILIKSF